MPLMRPSLMYLRHTSVRGGWTFATCRAAHHARLGNSIRCMATVSVTHETEPHLFSHETAFPNQPFTSPLEKGAHLLQKEALSKKLSHNPPYMLGRGYQASARLALLHLMNHATTGYLLHPSIPLDHTKDLRIADVGCGTGLWLGTLGREMPSTARLDGFDISDEQFPKGDPYGENVSLSKLDVFQPIPEHLRSKYDVIHLRYFMGVATDDSMQVAVDNLNAMLKPGGYLQWDEEDSISKMPVYASRMDAAQAQLRCYIRRHLWPRTNWINNIPSYFHKSGLNVVEYNTRGPLPMYRKPWTEDFLLAYAEVGDKMEDGDERDWFREMHAKAVEDAASGWHLDWELIMCVGKKALVA
ncbi:hypothetical protein N7G274_004548 [Stereocaulon virgatum]|uniref:S-adenosyl-L-methionine-dependent methyltransferase n=1 Tax=Stereocaulon virgatum TaxID=373712 RepID=A0ABR4ABD4_9LECA